MTMILSIDAGAEGAFAIIDSETKKLYHVCDFDDRLELGFSNYFSLDYCNMIALAEQEGVTKVVIEKVGAQRGQGMSSAFTFGTRFGETLCAARLITDDITLITPMKWKNTLGLKGAEKKKSAILCERLYPNHDFFSREKLRGKGKIYFDGRGDAVLIGHAAIKLGLV